MGCCFVSCNVLTCALTFVHENNFFPLKKEEKNTNNQPKPTELNTDSGKNPPSLKKKKKAAAKNG